LDSPLAPGRHVALIGFMGAGKSTLGRDVAERLGRELVDLDREIERQSGERVPELFARGEAAFRVVEGGTARDALRRTEPAVIALGGGAVGDDGTRALLRERAVTVLLEVDVDEAWRRSRGGDRPLARDEDEFRALYARRDPLYRATADFTARDVDDVVLAAGGVHVGVGMLEQLARLVPEEAPVALVADARVAGIYGADAQLALGKRVASMHELPAGEAAKSGSVCERLWRELALDRDGVLVALGGGSTTDAAGFVAATYLRGVRWVPVPTTLLGQVDAAIGGKTALNLPEGKNLVGAFHWPARTVVDPALLATLPAPELHAGLAEVVKTGLLAGEPFWGLPRPEQVRRCAAFKTAVCLRDPYERGPRTALNLGHTFAHALEAASDYRVAHGEAVALGLLAALRLSGLEEDVVAEQLRPEPVQVDRDRAWAALQRDKKRADGEVRLVLLDAPGKPRIDATVPEAEVRSALDSLIAG
jgi:shikimate kinase/3-dehydroquinate synthase